MLQKMKKIQFMGPKNDLQSVVDVLYHTGTVQLEDVSKTILPVDTILRKMDFTKAGELTTILLKLGGIFLSLPKIPDDCSRLSAGVRCRAGRRPVRRSALLQLGPRSRQARTGRIEE